MSNEDKPITSRRERRLAQAARASADEVRLTPAQAEAEARGRAEAEAAAARERGTAAARDARRAARESERTPSSAGTAAARRPRPPHEAEPDQPQGERSSQTRARNRAAQRVLRELAEKEQAAQSAAPPAFPQTFPTRRSLRERETGKIPPVGGQGTPQENAGPPGPSAQPLPVVPSQPPRPPIPGLDPAPPTAMQGIVPQGLTVNPALGPATGSFRTLSHEQIAAARELLKEQAKNQAAMIEAQGGASGTEVDPAVLAEQVAMAERAAILNRRAMAKQRLAEASRREAAPARKPPAPAATDNLAMVTPLEFVHLPGIAHPVMKPPTTTHVPVVTGRTARQSRAPHGAVPSAPPRLMEAAPVAARSAHGLEPLDSSQAGAGRAERERLILLGIAAVGVLALIAAIIMIVLGGR